MSVLVPERSGDPDPEAFARLVAEAYQRIPGHFRRLTKDLAIRTPDLPHQDILDEMGIDHPLGLLGLYSGVDVTRKSLFDISGEADTVFVYRLPIIAYSRETTDSIATIAEHVLVHEIGHHFGFSDDDMHAIEDSAD